MLNTSCSDSLKSMLRHILFPVIPNSIFDIINRFSAGYENEKEETSFEISSFRWGAVGETRTRTGLLPLPPQSSVSTISPPPLCFGIAKVRTFFKPPNFFVVFLLFLENQPNFIGTQIDKRNA